MNVLDRDLLLALAAVAIERIEKRGEGAGEFVRLGRILPAPLGSDLAALFFPVIDVSFVDRSNRRSGALVPEADS